MSRLEMIAKEALRNELRGRAGYESDQANYLIDQASFLFRLTISDEKVFRHLIPSTWVFAEDERPRTLERLVRQMRRRGLSWQQLAANPQRTQHPDWYRRVQEIYDQFDWQKMGPLFLTTVKGHRCAGRDCGDELENSPMASFSIANGLHCALALMTHLEEGMAFQAVDAILVLPRVDCP